MYDMNYLKCWSHWSRIVWPSLTTVHGLVHLIGRHQFTERLLVDGGDLSTMITSPIYSVGQLFWTLNVWTAYWWSYEHCGFYGTISYFNSTCSMLRPLTLRPWFDEECRAAKTECRQLQRQARRYSADDVIKSTWRGKVRNYILIETKRTTFWSDKIKTLQQEPAKSGEL